MEIADIFGGYGDEDTQALEKQLRDIELPQILEDIEVGRRKHQESLRQRIRNKGHVPVR